MSRAAECWFDAPDAFDRVEKALRSGEISATVAHRLWDYIVQGYFTASGLVPIDRIERLAADLDYLWFRETAIPGLTICGLTLDPGDTPFDLSHEEILQRPLADRLRMRDSGKWRIHGLHNVLSSCAELGNSPELWQMARTVLQLDEIFLQGTNTFVYSSQQGAHEDYAYLLANPTFQIAIAWLALEDVAEGQGPFFACPGSHREPKYQAFADHPATWFWNAPEKARYCWHLESEQRSARHPRLEFRARRGDCLFYHANLTHGGTAVTRNGSTRKSIVLFYTAPGTASPTISVVDGRPTAIGAASE